MKINKLNMAFIFFILFLVIIAFANIRPQSEIKVPFKRTYTVGYMKNQFSEVDLNDAQAAIKVWINELVKTFNFTDGYNIKVKIYNQFDELNKDQVRDSLAILAVNPFDYLNYGTKVGLDPVLVPSTSGDIFTQYYILVKKEDNFNNIKDLKGARIGLLKSENNIASKLWLDVILANNNIPDKARFFKKVVMSDKESQLILNLFFGQLDACVVSKGSYSLMAELNSQVADKITSIQISPKYLGGLLCFTKTFTSEKDRNLFYTNALKVQRLLTGKQLLSLIKVDRLVAFRNEYLDSYRDLIKEYSYLLKTKKLDRDGSF